MPYFSDESQARDNKLTIEDMAGGTFTISNVCQLKRLYIKSKIHLGRRLWFANGHSYHQSTTNG